MSFETKRLALQWRYILLFETFRQLASTNIMCSNQSSNAHSLQRRAEQNRVGLCFQIFVSWFPTCSACYAHKGHSPAELYVSMCLQFMVDDHQSWQVLRSPVNITPLKHCSWSTMQTWLCSWFTWIVKSDAFLPTSSQHVVTLCTQALLFRNKMVTSRPDRPRVDDRNYPGRSATEVSNRAGCTSFSWRSVSHNAALSYTLTGNKLWRETIRTPSSSRMELI